MFRDIRTRKAQSADEAVRDTGSYMSEGFRHGATLFICRASSASFNGSGTDKLSAALDIINAQIECSEFIPYDPSRSAEEHEEMALLEKVKQENRNARDDDRRWLEDWRAKELSRELAEADRRHKEHLAWQQSVEERLRDEQAKAAEKARSKEDVAEKRQRDADVRQDKAGQSSVEVTD
jgi:hypothetical protein